jgi:hypothetical protein
MTITYRRENAMSQALDRFYAAFPEIDGISLDTIRHFARDRFDEAATEALVSDVRFEAQGPIYAYTLLVREAAALAKALRIEGEL